jgi:hypothetical protein
MILSTDSNEIMGTSADGDDTVEFVVVAGTDMQYLHTSGCGVTMIARRAC